MRRSCSGTERELAAPGQPGSVDAAPAAMPRKHGLGGPWVTVRAHYGALPSLAGRDRRRVGESLPGWRVFKLAPAPGRTVPRTKKPPLAGRREAFPWPLFSGDPGDKPRLYYQGAPFGVPPPLTFRGEKKEKA